MIKRRQGGSTFMVMFFGFQSTSLCSQHPLVLVLSYSHCKNLLRLFLLCVSKFLNSCFSAFHFLYHMHQWNSFSVYLCLCSTIFIFMLALVGVFYPYNRGALFTALVVIYALTSGIAGYTATSFYIQLEGSNWVHMNSLL